MENNSTTVRRGEATITRTSMSFGSISRRDDVSRRSSGMENCWKMKVCRRIWKVIDCVLWVEVNHDKSTHRNQRGMGPQASIYLHQLIIERAAELALKMAEIIR